VPEGGFPDSEMGYGIVDEWFHRAWTHGVVEDRRPGLPTIHRHVLADAQYVVEERRFGGLSTGHHPKLAATQHAVAERRSTDLSTGHHRVLAEAQRGGEAKLEPEPTLDSEAVAHGDHARDRGAELHLSHISGYAGLLRAVGSPAERRPAGEAVEQCQRQRPTLAASASRAAPTQPNGTIEVEERSARHRGVLSKLKVASGRPVVKEHTATEEDVASFHGSGYASLLWAIWANGEDAAE
jgi:hypothetical protein